MMLTACNKKSSKEFIEGKAAELSKVYPTEDLQDLFEKFPDGFNIHSVDLYDYKEGEGYLFQSIKLEGDSETKSITGTILWEKVTIDDKKKNNYLNLIESVKNIEPNLVIDNNFLENLSKVNKEIIKNKEKLKIYTIDAFFNIIFKNIVTNLMKIKSYTMLDEEENFSYYKKVLENLYVFG
mgnify:CR=1 FL=1